MVFDFCNLRYSFHLAVYRKLMIGMFVSEQSAEEYMELKIPQSTNTHHDGSIIRLSEK